MLQQIAIQLDQAATNNKSIAQCSQSHKFSVDEAYEIQKLAITEREKRGDGIVGFKMGFTSKEKMQQMNVHDMIWGILTKTMHIENHDTVNVQNYIHPRIEPEIAFLTSKKIDKTLRLEELHDYISHTAIALEIIDSRYKDFTFSLEDVIADNCSSAGFTVGKWHDFATTKVTDLTVQLFFDEEIVAEGNTNAILENPIQTIIELSRLTEKFNREIPANSIILAGAATAAIALKPNTNITCIVQNFEEIALHTL